MNNKWRFTSTEIKKQVAGKGSMSLGRGFKTVKTSYPDLFELFIGLSGKIVVYNSQGDQILKTIEHIPFLPFRIQKIQRILEGKLVEDNIVSKSCEENG